MLASFLKILLKIPKIQMKPTRTLYFASIYSLCLLSPKKAAAGTRKGGCHSRIRARPQHQSVKSSLQYQGWLLSSPSSSILHSESHYWATEAFSVGVEGGRSLNVSQKMACAPDVLLWTKLLYARDSALVIGILLVGTIIRSPC